MATTPIMNGKPDVLIVGGGLAGIMAALAVHEKGGSPAIISLGPVGRSGNTVVAGGVISSATPDEGNTAERFLRDLLDSGRGIADPELASRVAEESEAMLLYMEKHGVQLRRQGKGFVRFHSPGHSIPRTVPTDWENVAFAARGRTFLEPLWQRLTALGIPQYNGFRVTRLVRDGKRVVGVSACERKTGRSCSIPAGSVIIATGGYGGLFRQHNNVADIYGDGIGLALEAGCTLRDMEFVQFYPMMLFKPVKSTIPGTLFKAGAVLRNSEKERFMDRYDPEGDGARRDAMARAIWLEARAGRAMDGSVYADCTAIPEERLRGGDFAEYYAILLRHGIDLKKDWITGKPAVHYTLGGIRIDEDGRTDVPGLYAAGEVCGGVHGVNRLAGCALMEAAVFGRRAGLAAVGEGRAAPSVDCAGDIAPQDAGEPARADLEADLKALQSLLWEKASLIRDAEGLTGALDGILALRAKWRCRADLPAKAFARNLLVAEAVVKSALRRTESRGAHYRSDYPETDPAQARPIECALRQGEIIIAG